MAKFNVLAEMVERGFNPSQTQMAITLTMALDDDLYEFIYQQSKFLLFILEGNGKPTTEEIAERMFFTVFTMSHHMDGAVPAYQHFLDNGPEAMLADIMVAMSKFNKKDAI